VYLGELKDFQLDGAKFLAKKKRAICAYDVGLGKTHIAMCTNEKLREYREINRTLVVCPNYLKWKWAYEIANYTDVSCVVLDGNVNKRSNTLLGFDKGYLVINYELLLQDYKALLPLNFDVVIADEVTRIKSYNSKTKAVLNRFRTEYRWGLTGTPVSNRPDELYSIMGWIDYTFFGKWYDFDQRYIKRNFFGGVDRYINLQELAQKSSERMISRTQEEAGAELPEVIVETLPLSFTPTQKTLYDTVAASLEGYLDVMVSKLLNDERVAGEEAKVRERFNALRMACVCPMLFEHSKSSYIRQSGFKYHDVGAKIKALFELIDEKIVGTQDKMIVFSFYREVLPIIAAYLDTKKIGYHILMGGMDAKETQDKISDFNSNPKTLVFLTTGAGEKGIDLQSAKYLVQMDLPFSHESYEQRMGRIKRIGATHKSVVCYNLVMNGSFEMRQLQIVNRKGELSETIRGKSNIDSIKPVDQSLRQFLKGE
jgi:SNF2 family DNA or RNA helicase